MSEEPRRSVRATKGQHKTLDLLDQPTEAAPVKKKGGKKGTAKKVEEQEVEEGGGDEEEIIRCICGAVEQDDDSDEAWICCEQCNAWQHNICMGVTINEKELEALVYYCEECKPEDHKETLAAIARGEKPWEERQRAYEESQQKGKKGKKGKAKRVSEPVAEVEKEVKEAKAKSPPAVVEVKKGKKEVAVSTATTKRKTRDGSIEDPAKNKVRKVSTPQPSSAPHDIPATIDDLPKDRHGAAKLIHRNLTMAMKVAKKNGIFIGSEPELDARSMRLTLEIERATFDTHAAGTAYINQIRKLTANLKTNQDLCNRLLQKTLTPSAFAIMSDDEMASKELQRQTAEMKARAEKQSIMVTEDGPRVRRTHKGDEVVEDDSNFAPATIEDTPAVRRRSMLDPNGDMATRSREGSVGDGDELPRDIDDYRSHDNIRANAEGTGELSTDTPASPPPPRKQSTQTGDFDINKVFNSVQSPTSATHARKPSVSARPQPPPRQGPGEDAEIDKMLEDGNESPPYSPAEYDSDPTIVWRGQMLMNSIASFPAVARHIGGADLSASVADPIAFSDLIPHKLSVAGRIEQDKANEYLCSLRYSPPTDIVIVALSPTGEAASDEFKKLYDYFTNKNKYGVVGDKSFANVRDTYLIPVPAGTGPIPEFMLNLENNKLPADRSENMILITLVVRQSTEPAANSTPTLPAYPQRQMSMGGPSGPVMSPITHQGTFGSPAPPNANNNNYAPASQQPQQSHPQANTSSGDQTSQRPQQLEAQRAGEAVARRILGDLIHAPTVGFLLPQAYAMQPKEWDVVKEILVADEMARVDLPYLSKLLEQRSAPSDGAAR